METTLWKRVATPEGEEFAKAVEEGLEQLEEQDLLEYKQERTVLRFKVAMGRSK
jgi:wyosine [tRNA(Phe)-imidazoG37] synthetase (radical SAM superfamily)